MLATDTSGFYKGPVSHAARASDATVLDPRSGYLEIYDVCRACHTTTQRWVRKLMPVTHYGVCATCASVDWNKCR